MSEDEDAHLRIAVDQILAPCRETLPTSYLGGREERSYCSSSTISCENRGHQVIRTRTTRDDDR